jgi:CHAT domain-containing protein
MVRRKAISLDRPLSCVTSLILVCALFSPTLARISPQSAADDLKPGQTVEREIKGGESHIYPIALDSNQYLRVRLEQRGSNLSLSLLAPDGNKVAEADAPLVTFGMETVLFVADSPGIYKIDVRPTKKTAPARSYEIRIEELRASTPADKDRISAYSAFVEAERLFKQWNNESQRKAVEKYEAASRLYKATGEPFLQAFALKQKGFALEFLNEHQKAIEAYHQALPLFENAGYKQEPALTLADMARACRSASRHRDALGYYQQALERFRANANRRKEADALLEIATVYDYLGDAQKAINFCHESVMIAHSEGDGDREAQALNYLGKSYYSLRDYQSALHYYNQALPLLEGKGKYEECFALHNAGNVHLEVGEFEKALEFFDKALAIMRRFGDKGAEASVLHSTGKVHLQRSEIEKALGFYNQSLKLFRESALLSGEAIVLNQIGKCYESAGDTEKALDHFNQALRVQQSTEDRVNEAITLSNISNIERRRGNIAEAIARIKSAIEIIESRRARVSIEQSRASLLASFQNFYELYISLLMQSCKGNKQNLVAAFEASERARARTLLDLLGEARINITEGVDLALLNRERELTQKLNEKARSLMQLLGSKHTEEGVAGARRELEAATIELQEIKASIRQASPRYAALTQPQPLTLAEIQSQILDPDSLLLSYSLGHERSFLWAVSTDSITAFEIAPRGEIESVAKRFYELLTSRNRQVKFETVEEQRERIAKNDAELTEAGSALSRLILSPVSSLLNRKRLLIVSDGALNYIPFAALPVVSGQWSVVSGKTESEKNRPPTTGYRPLIADHEIVNVPSASALGVLRREITGRKPAPRTVAVIADPVFDKNDERFQRAASRRPGKSPAIALQRRGVAETNELLRGATDVGLVESELNLPRLPATRLEAEAIASLVSRSSRFQALGFAASRATAKDPALGQYRYVHFATHGIINSRHPELSGIVLSQVDEEGREQDGFLRAHEVFNLRLPAELVVLSGCRTGLGKDVRGEGIVGLTRAFMYAGASRVMVSLWGVSDEGTAELMKRFYQGLLTRKLTPAAALREAQVSMMKDKRWQQPYYWAAFVLQGEPR